MKSEGDRRQTTGVGDRGEDAAALEPLDVFNDALDRLSRLEKDERDRILRALVVFFGTEMRQ